MEDKPDNRMSSAERRKKQYRDSKKKRRLEEKAEGVKEFSIKLSGDEVEALGQICLETSYTTNKLVKTLIEVAEDRLREDGLAGLLVLLGEEKEEEEELPNKILDHLELVTRNTREYIAVSLYSKNDEELIEFFRSNNISIRDLILSYVELD